MARVKIEDIVDELSHEFKNALAATIEREIPRNKYNINQLFSTFEREICHRCSTWENVPDSAVDKD